MLETRPKIADPRWANVAKASLSAKRLTVFVRTFSESMTDNKENR
jgi:hypothetical protein